MVKITKVYTRTGDGGTTSLMGGVRMAKDSARIEAYGTIDELSSQLGLLAAHLPNGHERDMAERTQANLFRIGAYLATDLTQTPLHPSAHLPQGETELVEREIDTLVAELPTDTGFILPGGTVEAAQAHVARAVCRRAERRMVAMGCDDDEGRRMRGYVNRLSDYLFVLAKKLNHAAGRAEKTWRNTCE